MYPSNVILSLKRKAIVSAGINAIHGIYPMLYAFYNSNGKLDRGAMRAQVEFNINTAKSHGIACLGLGTEVSCLDVDERIDVMQWAAKDIAGKVPLAVTIAGVDLDQVVRQMDTAKEIGADWLIVQPPLNSKPIESVLAEFFSAAMAATTLPVGIQNAPEYLGTGLSPTTVASLAQRHENFTVMKGEGAVCDIRPFIEAVNGKVSIFNGRGGLELPDNLRAGCAGMVPSTDSADMQVKIYQAYRNGDTEVAYKLYTELLPLIVFIMQNLHTFLCYGKLLAAQRLGITTDVRSRWTTMRPDEFGLSSLERFSQVITSSSSDF